RIVAFPDDGDLIAAFGQMAVDAIGRHVQHAVVIPADVDIAGVVDVAHRARTVGLDPVYALAVFAPERGGIPDRSLVHRLVLGRIDIGALGPIGADVDQFIGHGFPPACVLPRITGVLARRRHARQFDFGAGFEGPTGHSSYQIVKSCNGARSVIRLLGTASGSAWPSARPQITTWSSGIPSSRRTTCWKRLKAACGQVCRPFSRASSMSWSRKMPQSIHWPPPMRRSTHRIMPTGAPKKS